MLFNSIAILQCYSLASIGYGVVTFNNCKDASDELKQVNLFYKKFMFFKNVG